MRRTSVLACWMWLGVAGLALAGCAAVGPDYVPPESQVPSSWQDLPDPAVVPSRADILNWWQLFNDPLLNDLVSEAVASNLDLQVAVARVAEARAFYEAAGGERFPVVDAEGQVERGRTSENLGVIGGGSTATTYTVGLGASWEIDLFGRIRRSIEAAAANYQASEEDRTDVLVALLAEVARSYLDLRTYQARLDVTQANIRSQKEILRLTDSRFRNGLATGLDVAQAQRILASSEADLPPLRTGVTNTMYAIDILLGLQPGSSKARLQAVQPIPVPPARVAIGVPADILRQRPDIRRAERELAAQTARIGVATADLYPYLSLTGTLGLASISSSDFFDSDSGAWSLGGILQWRVFDGGRIRALIRVQDARTQQALLLYERTVLSALQEVESALTAYAEERRRLEALRRSADASRRTLDLSTLLYKQGLTDFENVLDALRAVLSSEDNVATAEGNVAINLAVLYRTLGGGWDAQAPEGGPQEKAGEEPKE